MVRGDAGKQIILQVWPVPATGFFNVSVSGLDKPVQLQVLDISGRLIKSFQLVQDTQLKISDMPAGTYILKLAGNNKVIQKAIMQ